MSDTIQPALDTIDVTLPLDESVRMARASWTLHATRLTLDHFQLLSHIRISAYALTHIDLPEVPGEPMVHSAHTQETLRSSTLSSVSEQFQNASVPFSVDCLIFNFTEKQRWMERQLNEAVQRCGETSYLPTRPIALWRSEDYKLILKTLAVDVSDIEKKLGNRRKDDVNDKGVIFFTGWRAFTPLYKDCGNPSWWAWHPFLLHPYLTPEAAEWLADRNVRVVGTDAVSVDSLVRQWLLAGELCPDLEAPWKEIREAVAAWKRNEEKNLSHRGYMKVHRTMINSGALIIESLALTSAVLLLGDESGLPHIGKNGIQLPEVASARITVLPFVSEKGLNALPVYAILFPPERPQS